MTSAPIPQSNDTHLPPDSVSSRYVVTLGAQAFRLLLSLVSAVIVPRTLGPAVYGNYSFLLSTAATLRGFVDNSAQQAFFTFSSQERASGPLTRLYAVVLAAQFFIILAIIGVAALAGATEWLWQGQQLDQIVLIAALDWAIFLALSLQQLGDSKGLSVQPQLIGAAVALVTLAGLLLLWWSKTLDFYTFAWLNLASALSTCALLSYWMLARNGNLFWNGTLAVGAYARRWWSFAKPLILIQYYLPAVTYLGLYLIQRWYGSVEQGYYALALQWSSLALVFTNAAVSIFWRELAHQNAARNVQLAAGTYEQFSRLLFLLALVLACWLCASSDALVAVIAGESYAAAASVVAIMAFYPAAQTLGQLSAAALKAAERTATFARWSIALSVPDLLLTYLLLAPATAAVPGLQLGADGLAIKTAIYGLVSVEVYDWLNRRALGLSYVAALVQRIGAIAAIGLTAFIVVDRGGAWLRSMGFENVATLVISSVAYAAAVLTIVWLRPNLAGLTSEQIMRGLRMLSRRDAD